MVACPFCKSTLAEWYTPVGVNGFKRPAWYCMGFFRRDSICNVVVIMQMRSGAFRVVMQDGEQILQSLVVE